MLEEMLEQKCITDCRVKPKVVKVDGKEKHVNEVKPSEIVDTIFSAWEKVVESPTQESYASNVMQFRDVCKNFPKFLDYVQSSILDIVKEKLVKAWTNLVLHLGCRTTNRVEGAHGIVKAYLTTSVCDLGTCYKKIHEMLVIQLVEIQTSFGMSVTVLEHRYKDVILYSGLGGNMSRQATNNIFVEEERARQTLCMVKKTCGCVQRTSYGLPRACIIAMKVRHNKPIRLDEIYLHWQRNFFSDAEKWGGI
jgi:hypothetical protein